MVEHLSHIALRSLSHTLVCSFSRAYTPIECDYLTYHAPKALVEVCSSSVRIHTLVPNARPTTVTCNHKSHLDPIIFYATTSFMIYLHHHMKPSRHSNIFSSLLSTSHPTIQPPLHLNPPPHADHLTPPITNHAPANNRILHRLRNNRLHPLRSNIPIQLLLQNMGSYPFLPPPLAGSETNPRISNSNEKGKVEGAEYSFLLCFNFLFWLKNWHG